MQLQLYPLNLAPIFSPPWGVYVHPVHPLATLMDPYSKHHRLYVRNTSFHTATSSDLTVRRRTRLKNLLGAGKNVVPGSRFSPNGKLTSSPNWIWGRISHLNRLGRKKEHNRRKRKNAEMGTLGGMGGKGKWTEEDLGKMRLGKNGENCGEEGTDGMAWTDAPDLRHRQAANKHRDRLLGRNRSQLVKSDVYTRQSFQQQAEPAAFKGHGNSVPGHPA